MRIVLLIIAAATLAATARPASAVPQFQVEFWKKYVNDSEDKEWQELVKKKAKCNVCHQGLKKREHVNAYGYQLSLLLDRKEDMKDKEKIQEVLEKVGKVHSDPNDWDKEKDEKEKKSPTFEELIKAGKLPAGDLKKLQEEPEEGKEHWHHDGEADEDHKH